MKKQKQTQQKIVYVQQQPAPPSFLNIAVSFFMAGVGIFLLLIMGGCTLLFV